MPPGIVLLSLYRVRTEKKRARLGDRQDYGCGAEHWAAGAMDQIWRGNNRVCAGGVGVALRSETVGRDRSGERAEGDAGAGDDAVGWRDLADGGPSWAGGAGELLGDMVWALPGGDAGVGQVIA